MNTEYVLHRRQRGYVCYFELEQFLTISFGHIIFFLKYMFLTLIKKLMFCDIFNVIFFIPCQGIHNVVCEELLGYLKSNKSLYVMLIYFSIIIVSFVF